MINKKIYQSVSIFMAFLIILNSFMPLTIIAETTDKPSLLLGKVVKGQNDKSLNMEVTINELQDDAKIQASHSVIQNAVLEQDGKKLDLVIDGNQSFYIPKIFKGVGIIHLILGDTSNLMTIDFNFENQSSSYILEQAEEMSENKEVNSKETSNSSSEVSHNQQASSSTSETNASTFETKDSEVVSSDESVHSFKKNHKNEQSIQPTDIRKYFENGSGTIITDSKLIFLDEKGNVVEPPITSESNVRISYNWKIPEEVRQKIQSGDYFNFKLPDELKPKRILSGELKNNEGEVYATYVIDTEGNIRFNFTEEIQKQSEIEGWFRFDTMINKDHIDSPGDITIHYPIEDNLPSVDVEIRPNTDQSIAKSGHFDRTPNPNGIEWVVDFNQSMSHLTEATITETWPSGIDFKSVEVMELIMNLDGTIKGYGRKLLPDEYVVDPLGNVRILGETNKAFRIIYQTTINNSIKPENGGKISFTNTAKLTDKTNEAGIDAKSTVTTYYGKPIEKNTIGYDSVKQEFSWGIKYNYNEDKISKQDAVLTDTISQNMELVDQSVKVYPITFDEQGNEIKGEPFSDGIDYILVPHPSENGFVVQFLNNVNQAIKIEYKTKVNKIVTNPAEVSNKVSTGNGKTSQDKGTAYQQNVIKNISDIDYSTKKVGWKISVNKNNYEMNNLILKDRYSPTPGLSMVVDGEGEYDFVIRDLTKNKLLTKNTDYILTLVKDNNGNELGFNVEFKNEYIKTNSELEIFYYTAFDVSLLNPSDIKTDRFNNTMSAEWKDKYGEEHSSKDDKYFRPVDPYQLNAQKSGKYNAQNKHITWTIAVNHSRNLLNNAQLIDVIRQNQSFVKGSVKVYEALVKKDGTVIKKQPEKLVNDKMKYLEEPSKSNDQTLSIAFPEGEKQTYLIEFETSLEGKIVGNSKQYTNKAQYENNNDKRDVIGEVSIKNGGKHIQKSGNQNKQNPDYVDWKVIINPSQSTLKNVVIKDQPSENQVIDSSSIKIFETKLSINGSITTNYEEQLKPNIDYTVDLITDNVTGQQMLTIKLLREIQTAYQLEYSSYITSSINGNKDKVSNKINISGDNDQIISGSESKDIIVEIHHSDGSATGKKGKIALQKTEADATTKLSGAHFQLWNTSKSQLLREGDVDDDGKIIFGNLPFGEYLLIETDAPEGFTISDELTTGKKIKINDQTSSTNAMPLIIPNDRNKVLLKKTDDQGNPIKFNELIQMGARFKIEHFNRLAPAGLQWEEVKLNQDRVDSNGMLEITSLPLGQYRITEIEAPTGYILNTESKYFQVLQNSAHQIPTINLEIKNYYGEVELSKIDNEGKTLSGAEFNIIDSKGNIVNKEPLVSQNDGKIFYKGLAPGKYSFVETRAPEGYIINTKEISFIIDNATYGAPSKVVNNIDDEPLESVNYRGSVEFTKKNEEGNLLEGAEFDLLNDKGQKINQQPIVSDKEGKVNVKNLGPGKYSFSETKAPKGYLINSNKVSFTIEESSSGPVEVTNLGDFINYQGSFQLIKRNTDFEVLEGATFTLFDQYKKSLGVAKDSDENGKVTFDKLAPGIYYFQETKGPKVTEGSDYVVNPALIKVIIPEKEDGKPDIFQLGDFQNFRGKAQITKVGEGGSIAGTEFKLVQIMNGNEKFIRNVTTPENGILDISKLGVGSYKLQEIKAAPGYVINEQPIYFVVQESDDKNPTIDNLGFENYQIEISGIKVDQDGKALSGAEYQVFNTLDQKKLPLKVIDRNGNNTEVIRSDEKGEIYFKGLGQGNYVLVETKAPEGYILDTTPRHFEVKEYLGKPEKIDLGQFINYKGEISLTKKDEFGNVLQDAEFEIRDIEGKIQTTTDSEGNKIKKIVSTSEGRISASGLAPGKYKLIETNAPEGYLLNKKIIPFEIGNSSSGKPKVVILSDFINYRGSVRMKKVSESGQSLTGAEFELHKEDGNVFGKYKTDSSGILTITKLAPGNYYLSEVKAPEGYVLNSKKVYFDIPNESNGKTEAIELSDFVNYQGSVKMKKVSENGIGLANAVFELYDKNKILVDKYTTDKEGQIMVNNLSPGEYFFKEIKAPIGYELSSQLRRFKINESSEDKPQIIDAGNFVNTPLGTKIEKVKYPKKTHKVSKVQNGALPRTDDLKNNWLLMIGIVVLIIVGGIYLKRKHEETNGK